MFITVNSPVDEGGCAIHTYQYKEIQMLAGRDAACKQVECCERWPACCLPDENRVMSTVLTSNDFLNTRQVMAERSWQDSCPIW